MAKVTGVGGVFFKSRGDSRAPAAWYQKHLGMPLADFGSAGWRYRVALESVLGFTLRYRVPDSMTTYEIVVTRAAGDPGARALASRPYRRPA